MANTPAVARARWIRKVWTGWSFDGRRTYVVEVGGLLTAQQLAELAGATPRAIRADVRSRKLRAIRIGRREYRFTPAEARRYLHGIGATPARLKALQRMTVTYRLGSDDRVTAAELAEVLQVSTQHIRNLARRDMLMVPAINIGSRLWTDGESAWLFLTLLAKPVGRGV